MRREHWDRKYAASELLWSAAPNRFVVAELAGLEPGRALDLACGEGRNALWLARLGWEVTGVDFSEVAIERASELADHEQLAIEYVCADLLEYQSEPDAFDLVLVLYLQVPASERRRIFERAVSALRVEGTFLLVGHDLSNLLDGVGGPQDPELLYTADDVVSDLEGLEIEKAERVYRDVAEADRPAIDALVRARRPAPG
ncbi:MAG: class I SAM-dependent methyltransferase [Gaiellaceae bacterium]